MTVAVTPAVAAVSALAVSRVTVVAPTTRIDVALPHGATFAELLPQLLRMTGADERDVDSVHGGWVLCRLGEPPLDLGRPVDVLGLRDGELLYLTSRRTQLPPPLYDDVADAIASSGRSRLGRWSPAATRGAGLASAGVLLVVAAAATVTAGPGTIVPAVVAFCAAGLLLLVALVLARAEGDSTGAAVVAVAAPVHAFVGGLLLLAPSVRLGGVGRSQVLLAFVAALLVGALAVVVVGDRLEIFLGEGLVAALGTIVAGCAVAAGLRSPAAAAIGAALALALAPLLPILSLRLAGISLPRVPKDATDLENDSSSLPDGAIGDRADQADSYLSAMVVATAAVAGACALVVAAGDITARVLAAVVVAILLLRARVYAGVAQRSANLLAALAAATGLVIVLVERAQPDERLAATGALLALGAGAALLALLLPGRHPSPYWGRLVDIIEILLLTSIVPLALGVLGVYGYLRGLGG